MLNISNISKSFGGIKALNDVSLNIEKGKITDKGNHKQLLNQNTFYSQLYYKGQLLE